MMHARYVTGPAARGAAVAAALICALPFSVQAQDLRGPINAAPSPLTEGAQAPAAQPVGPRPISQSVAAVVNDEIISTYDLEQRMRLLLFTSGVQPTQEMLPQFQREALISLIDERLQFQELRKVEKEQKFTIIATDEEVREELGAVAQQSNLTLDQLNAQLRARGINPDTLMQQYRAQISWERWISGRYGSRLRVGEDQVSATLQRMAAAASKPQYQISEVLIDANRVGGMEVALQGAQQLIAQLQQGAPFAAVARQFSAAPTAAAGGDAGWVLQGEMPPEVDAVLDRLRPGQLSPPIQVRDGVYIIYLRDKRSGAGASLVNLKQAAIALPQDASAGDLEAARVKLEGLRVAVKGCDGFESAAGKVPGVVAGDLGEAEVADLRPEFRQAAESLQVGQVSAPIRTNVGLHVLAVCGKRSAGEAQLDRRQIENRLVGQQLNMISRRYMRDLRNSATIETR